jgi:hypothetical protein
MYTIVILYVWGHAQCRGNHCPPPIFLTLGWLHWPALSPGVWTADYWPLWCLPLNWCGFRGRRGPAALPGPGWGQSLRSTHHFPPYAVHLSVLRLVPNVWHCCCSVLLPQCTFNSGFWCLAFGARVNKARDEFTLEVKRNGSNWASTGSVVTDHYFFKSKTVVREGVGAGGRNDPNIVCTYE